MNFPLPFLRYHVCGLLESERSIDMQWLYERVGGCSAGAEEPPDPVWAGGVEEGDYEGVGSVGEMQDCGVGEEGVGGGYEVGCLF